MQLKSQKKLENGPKFQYSLALIVIKGAVSDCVERSFVVPKIPLL